ncbi:hypothetical protein SacmaDRAFT_4713 [Saccharomonospora marina XMU15]|uniref:AIG2-like family protein n=1 Tax=Saccharomonospora marina XMU15 TaxID=882083 RepID=H5WY20_9PSEU|nr:gamma-glutamylcyclotransferase family protein [Saccharomonospora marina]EHR52887.1 hypothetical protein SacmaDRAFT_4713 [Saccharomonospora marina XMU15]
MLFVDRKYPAEPYPGARPGCSFVHRDGAGYPLSTARPRWRTELTPVLAYGSNACPEKITWLRRTMGLTGAVVVARARCHGMAAVWAAGFRERDGARPATLAAAPGVEEWHAVWFATPDQLAVLDRCEGRGTRYDLVRLREGAVRLEDGSPVEGALAYVGAAAERMPLLVDGEMVRMAVVPQRRARLLTGVPAASHGLRVEPVSRSACPG